MSSNLHQNYSTEMECAINHVVNLHLTASHTYLPLSFYFEGDEVALESIGHFLQELAKEKHKDAKVLSKIQIQ